MIVGFTITSFNGYEKEAAGYIRKVCILESPDIALNIVNAGPGVNVFSQEITVEDLNSQPFSAVPIETREGKFIIASKVNFILELLYNGSILRLTPTEYVYIDAIEVSQFEDYIHEGLVRVFPEGVDTDSEWILSSTYWDDNGVWVDSETWRD